MFPIGGQRDFCCIYIDAAGGGLVSVEKKKSRIFCDFFSFIQFTNDLGHVKKTFGDAKGLFTHFFI
ncbi:MAG: hypothetical protein IJB35_02855, partial [Oscillospiraceae bacterium]|nr:hypothetical protein [Oscillospiraceae bacterium]